MLQMNWSSSFSPKYFSPKYHPLQQTDSIKTLQRLPVRQIHSVLNRSQGKIKSHYIKCSESSFFLTKNIINKWEISNRKLKQFNKYLVNPVTLQKDHASTNEDDDNYSTSFQDILLKKLNAIYRFARPFSLLGTIVAITSISILPLQSFADLTPKYFTGSLMALLSAMLMNTYVGTVNQLTDVEIDKVNKPDLPIASGDLSMGPGIVITLTCAVMSLAIAIRLKSPPLVYGLVVWFLLGTAYSVHLPFLRWKANPFLAAMCMMIAFGLVYQFPFFIHIQKYVLGRHVVITRPLIFTAAISCCFSIVMSLLKDIPDEEGDQEFGIRSLSVRIGKERVLWICVYMLSIAYGGGIIVGASSSSLLGKLVSIIGHSTLASLLWLRTRTIDLSNNASTFSFYMFIWRLFYAEYFLIHFLR